MLKGCASIIILLALAALLITAGVTRISENLADWKQADSYVKTVEVQETQATERTRIIVDGNIEIAKIQADVDKKTDFTYLLFWVVRAAAWGLGIVAVFWAITKAVLL